MLKTYFVLTAVLAKGFLLANAFAVGSFDGPVTQNDINSFKAGIQNMQPPSNIVGVDWAQGKTGMAIKSFGFVYEISRDTAILNKMLTYTDKLISLRNDKSPDGCTIWTGSKDPVWVNCTTNVLNGQVYTAGDQGDYVGHIGYAARLVLQNPSIWNTTVPDSDPYRLGSTYYLRAARYAREADHSLDKHINLYLLDYTISQRRQYFAATNPYKGGLPVPWNQQMMFNYGFSNMALAHSILADNPGRVTKYNSIVQASVDWFFSTVTSYKTAKGNPAYLWNYSVSQNDVEDSNHAHLDIGGFARLFYFGSYGLTQNKVLPFANTVLDVIIRGSRNYAGRIDGTDGAGNSSPTTYLRSGHLLSAEFLMGNLSSYVIDLVESNIPAIDVFANLLWAKHRLSLN